MKVYVYVLMFCFIGLCQAEYNLLKIDTYFEVENELLVGVAVFTDSVEKNNEKLCDNNINVKVVVKKNIYDSVANQIIYHQGRNRFVFHREIEGEPYHLFRKYTLPCGSSDLLIGDTKLSRELRLEELNEIGLLIDKALFDMH